MELYSPLKIQAKVCLVSNSHAHPFSLAAQVKTHMTSKIKLEYN